MAHNKIILSIAITIIFTFLAAIWVYKMQSEAPIFDKLTDEQSSAVEAYLSTNGIPYSFDSDTNHILVSNDLIYKLRMELVTAGVISDGRVGFEIFDENDYGVTEFAQKINYQRALQGELEKTIAAIDGVRNVRVHLKMTSTKSLFEDKKPVTASVVLYQESRTAISKEQVLGIKNLVSGAVEGLSHKHVNVLDSFGRDIGNKSASMGSSYIIDDKNKIEQEFVTRIEKILLGVFSKSDFKVSVTVDVDTTSKTSEIESIPNRGSGALVKKVSNSELVSTDDGKSLAKPTSEIVEYKYGRQFDKIIKNAGEIKKISAGVVITVPIDDKNLSKLKKAISAAVGLNSKRNDELQVIYMKSLKNVISNDLSKMKATNHVRKKLVNKNNVFNVYYFVYFLLICVLILIVMLFKKNQSPNFSQQQKEELIIEIENWINQE